MMYPFYFKRPYRPYYSPRPPQPQMPPQATSRRPVQKAQSTPVQISVSKTAEECKKEKPQMEFFEILGFKLYYDDLLIIGLIFLLFEEGINDSFLLLSLILLIGE